MRQDASAKTITSFHMRDSPVFSLKENISLKTMNTLKLEVCSRYYASVNSVSEIRQILNTDIFKRNNIYVLGGGSNTLFTKDYQGLVVKINMKGMRVVHEDEKHVHLEIRAGEDWPTVVEYAVAKGWGGIENLAMVPGTAGAAPVQNIACYGHNLHETLLYVDALSIADGSSKRFTAEECQFGYRTSIFKKDLTGKFIIIGICLKLDKNPRLNTSYKSRYESVEDELAKIGKPPYNIGDVFRAIVNIRKKKLPDINDVGTVGSVFKNPLVSREQLQKVRELCPDIHCYPESHLSYPSFVGDKQTSSEMVKIPAAWLIADMGWCGMRVGNCGIWEKQPINIVNYGNSTPEEYLSFVNMVKDAVYDRYLVSLETEVVIV